MSFTSIGTLAGSLHAVGMEVHVRLGSDGANCVHVLKHAGFVIREDDADQLGVRTERTADIVGTDQTSAIDWEVRHLAAGIFEPLAGIQNGVVLDRRSDEVVAGLGQSEERQIVALGASAGEDDFGGTAVHKIGDMLAGLLDRGARLLALLVDGRGIAELLQEVGLHGRKHLRQKGAGRVVVEIHPAHR